MNKYPKTYVELYQLLNDDLMPVLRQSLAALVIVPPSTDQIDVKQALEIGYSILTNKPIILVVLEGRQVPRDLMTIAAEVVHIQEPIENNFEPITHAINRTIERVTTRESEAAGDKN